MYLTIKTIHISLVAISFTIFVIRGLMMLKRNTLYRHRLFRLIPPIIDTLLLGTGITLMILIQQYPTTQSWLAVKLLALVIYIILGVIALNRVDNFKIQLISFSAAVSTILFMVSVAITHNPLGIFSLVY